MKIMQVNIWGGKLLYRLMDFIAAEQPDFVCMQEVNDLNGPSGALFASLEQIRSAAAMEHSFMSSCYSYKYMQRDCGYGNAILSRLPFETQQTIFTNGSFKDNFDLTDDDYNVRNLQHATFKTGSSTLHILNHHGFLVRGSKDGNAETLGFNQKIVAVMAATKGPLILTGDFNLQPHSPSMQVLTSRLTDLTSKYGITSTYNQFNNNDVVCDYILINDAVKARDFRVSEALVSDHKALILEFDL